MLTWIQKYDYLLVFFFFWLFFLLTSVSQKLEFYNMQNAVVESLVEKGSFGIKGNAYQSNWFIQNLQTKTPQLSFIGDVYEHNGLWYPAKSYGAHYMAALVYIGLKMMGLSFTTNYHLVSFILLACTSFILTSIGTTLTYLVAKRITGSYFKGLLVAIFLTFGSLLTGGINIRNEETFGFWLFVIVYMLTFWSWKNRWTPIVATLLLVYSAYSLPIATLLVPLGLYRIYLAAGRKRAAPILVTFVTIVIIIAVHNYLIFGRWVFSNYSIGMEKVAGYKLGSFFFSWPNFVEKVQFYFLNSQTSIFTNYPLIVLALVGILISRETTLAKLVIFGTIIGFAFYITNIGELTGYVGFGSGRYMMGIFPVAYIYLAYVFKRFQSVLWITTAIAAVISIQNGLFFYFSPVRHVLDRSSAHFNSLPLKGYFFMLVAALFISVLYLSLFAEDKLLKRKLKLRQTK